ncbi:MAG: NUDIX hydrolase [Flavobacteriaceae bacterium]|nr:MAG: NUDIX hydrolase [Flavobacteriaceae bacterium]
MYKIFLKQTCLHIGKEAITDTTALQYDSEDLSFKKIIKQMSKQKIHFSLVTQNPELAFEDFRKEFEVIHAAGGLVENKNDEILTIFRLGKWDLPKGKVEPKENFASAALREVSEECGIFELKIENYLHTTYHLYKIDKSWALKLTHWYHMSSPGKEKLIPQTDEDIAKAEWMSKQKIEKELLPNTYPNIALSLSKLFKQKK